MLLRRRRETLLKLGFEHEEIIDREQLRELLPAIAPHCVGGMLVRGDGHANPFFTVQAFKRKALALGVRFIESAPVEALQRQADTWRVKSAQADLQAPTLVNCAGAWGGRVAAMLGEHAPVEAQALMLMITARVKRFVKPVVGAQGRTLSLKQFDNGTVLIGGGYRGRAGPSRTATGHIWTSGALPPARSPRRHYFRACAGFRSCAVGRALRERCRTAFRSSARAPQRVRTTPLVFPAMASRSLPSWGGSLPISSLAVTRTCLSRHSTSAGFPARDPRAPVHKKSVIRIRVI